MKHHAISHSALVIYYFSSEQTIFVSKALMEVTDNIFKGKSKELAYLYQRQTDP